MRDPTDEHEEQPRATISEDDIEARDAGRRRFLVGLGAVVAASQAATACSDSCDSDVGDPILADNDPDDPILADNDIGDRCDSD